MNQREVTRHFDKIAKDYDRYKKNHAYYSFVVRRELAKRVPKGKRILDYGSGTGENLNFLSPKYGVGFDPSYEMIKIAKKKFAKNKKLLFTNSLGRIKGMFDYVISVDTIEHFPNPTKEFRKMKKFMTKGKNMNPDTKLIVSYVDRRWNWLIAILGAIRPKTPEGPNNRITQKEVIVAAQKAGLKLISPVPFWLIDIFVFKKNES